MSALLKSRGMAFHCDGARLWEAQSFYREPLHDLCQGFDSVYVSFYKASSTRATSIRPPFRHAVAPSGSRSRVSPDIWV